jgi:hypothetical protein
LGAHDKVSQNMTTVNKYFFEQKIHTLIHNAAGSDPSFFEFSLEGIRFEHIDSSFEKPWTTDYWLATAEIIAPNVKTAQTIFETKLKRTANGICLVGQAYFEYEGQTRLIQNKNKNWSLFFYRKDTQGNPLILLPEAVQALAKMLSASKKYDIFLQYWKDVTNTYTPSSKLILYCAAIDALTKTECPPSKNWEKEKHRLREKILGKKLKEKLYGTEKNYREGLRHKLTHGELPKIQFNLEEIHRPIIAYFNDEIFKNAPLPNDIVSPQRNVHGNVSAFGHPIRFKKTAVSAYVLENDFETNFKAKLYESFEFATELSKEQLEEF